MNHEPIDAATALTTLTPDPPDWNRWENETVRAYLLRIISQALWVGGDVAHTLGDTLGDKMWDLSDWLLNTAHPTTGPVDIDLGAGR